MNKTAKNEVKQIKNIGILILLHLLPGLIVMTLYSAMAYSDVFSSFPRLILLAISGVFGIALAQLGILCYVAKKESNSFNFINILGLKSKLSLRDYVMYSVLVFLVVGLLITVTKGITTYLQVNIFGFVPKLLDLAEDMSIYSQGMIVGTVFVSFIVIAGILPVIEELYFRGFLMARMKWMGVYGVLFNTFLFALYHFWSPWMIVARVIALFPLFYIAYKKDSLKLSIIVHCMANLTDAIALLAYL